MDKVHLIIEKINTQLLGPKKSSISIAAIGLTVVVLVHTIIGNLIKPPRHLRHIPHVNYLKYIMMAMIQKQPCGVLFNTLTMPLLSSSPLPIYLKPGFLGWTVQIVTPEAAKHFFLKTDTYPKADLTPINDTLIYKYTGARNILTATTKEEWKKHRKLVNPAFNKTRPLKTFGINAHKVFQILDHVNDSPVDVTALMERYALDVIGQTGFGFDFDSILHQNNEWVKVYNSIKTGLHNPVFLVFPWLEKPSFLWLFSERQKKHHHVTQFHAMLSSVIENKRKILQQTYNKDADDDKDLLTLMLESEFTNQGTILTDAEIKSNLNVFFFGNAGHDTTANALAFTIHALARDPDLQQKAREEAIRILGDAPHNVLPTLQDIKQMDYLGQVIKETLRFNGPATAGTPRRVAHDTKLMGLYFLPKGTPISVSIYDMHHNPHVWDNPEIYDPDRFAPGGEADQKANTTEAGAMAWSPFYNGQRMCIGMQFSLEQQKVMLSTMLRKYEWRLPKDSIHKENVVTTTIGIIRPKNLEVIFRRR